MGEVWAVLGKKGVEIGITDNRSICLWVAGTLRRVEAASRDCDSASSEPFLCVRFMACERKQH